MPFQMVHLVIARKVLERTPYKIQNLPQFYLGSLAPDAVHFRENFAPEDKKASHLCVGDERWGDVSNNEDWTDSVLQFFNRHGGSERADFVLGYCAHVLADIQNNIDLWSPFKLEYYHSLKIPDCGNLYDSEALKIFHADDVYADKKLYLTSGFREEIWNSLRSGKGIDLDGIVSADEIDKIRDNVLYRQYSGISVDGSYVGKIISYEDYLKFIDKTSEAIAELLFR